MNFLSVGAKLNKQMAKAKLQIRDLARLNREVGNVVNDDDVQQQLDSAEKMVWNEYEANVRTGLEAMSRFKAIAAEMGHSCTNWYHITISPPDENFVDFYNAVKRLLDRACFVEFSCSFEQRGQNLLDMGRGYHCHIVANMRQRSKAEVIRDVASTMKNICDAHFIQVDTTRNPKDIVDNYLLEYKSNDGHKEPLKEWDAKWRTQNNLLSLYTTSLPPFSGKWCPPLCKSVKFD